MNIVEPYARIMRIHGHAANADAGIEALRFVEWCARISHRSEDKQDDISWEKFVRFVVLTHGDWSVTEHVNVTVDAVVDRGITHEWVRHRLFAFTQESTRFVNYEKKMPPSFIRPIGVDTAHWDAAISTCEAAYKALLVAGCAPQIARSVFPNALASRIVTTGNLRNWRHFLIMRTCAESHPQMRQVTIPLLAQFKELIPILYEDIEPYGKQSEAIKKAR